MLALSFNPWVVNPTLARVFYEVLDPDGDGVALVEYKLFRAGQEPTSWTQTASASAELTLDVTNYSGVVQLKVRATNFSSTQYTGETQISANNYVPPSPPDWVSFRAKTTNSITLVWGSDIVSPTVASWRVIGYNHDGQPTILADKPLGDRQAALALTVANLYQVRVYGVTAQGQLSAPSPVLTISPDPNAPTIVLESWTLSTARAEMGYGIGTQGILPYIYWSIARSDGLQDSGYGLPQGQPGIDVVNFVGTVYFTITATDNQGRSTTTTSQTQVFNRPPLAPTIVIEETGIRFVRLRAVPANEPDMPIVSVRFYGPTGPVVATSPFVVTFEDLSPSTRYLITASSVNGAGIAGPASAPADVTTLIDPIAPPVDPGNPGDPLTLRVANLIVGDVRAYLLQLFTDTRIRAPLAQQIVDQPLGMDSLLELFYPIAKDFGAILRKETTDAGTYDASELIDRTPDPVEKLSIFAERLAYGNIWNKG